MVVRFFLSYLQVSFLKTAREENPRLLGETSWKKAADYGIKKEQLSMASTAIEAFIAFFWLFFALKLFDQIVTVENEIYKTLIFINMFLFINYLFELPLAIYEKFVLDEQFGFNKSTFGQFIADQTKTVLLVAIIGSIVALFIAWFISSFANWWLISFIFLMAVLIFINMLFPVIRAKMFDKFTPLDGTEIGEKIATLMDQTGFRSSGAFKVDASKRDARLNAYFAGFGKTKRVVLFDTLIEKLTTNELLAVLGHELGHFKHGDIFKNISIMGILLFVFLAIFGNLPNEFFVALNLNPTPHNLIAIFLIFSSVFFFFAMPFFNAISRYNEFRADQFGGELVEKNELKNALIKLVQENVKFPKSHKLYALFYETHPSVLTRVERLEE